MGNGGVRSHRHSVPLTSPREPGLSRQVKREGEKLLPASANALSCPSWRVEAAGEGRWELARGQGRGPYDVPKTPVSTQPPKSEVAGRITHSPLLILFLLYRK